MTQATINTKISSGLALKGGMFTLTAIQLQDYHPETLSLQLDDKIKQAPNFFQYAPIILDLRAFPQTVAIDFYELVNILKAKKLIPIGVRGIHSAQKEAAIAAGLAIFPEEKASNAKKNMGSSDNLAMGSHSFTTENSTLTRTVHQPIRSGQQIYVPGGDLIITTSVSHGAEILADGHIHIYGPLRGRALAGVMGNTEAMIFCKSLEAELVSVAGQYYTSEDLKETYWKQSVCIHVQDGRLNIRLI